MRKRTMDKEKDIEKNKLEMPDAEIAAEQNSIESEVTNTAETGAEAVPVTAETVEKEFQEKLKQSEDRYLRLAAEFDNYKKRIARQYEEMVRAANEEVLLQLLELADNLRRGLDAAEKTTEVESLRKGTELIYQQMNELLKRFGVETIAAVGEKFDPNWHEAVMQIPSEKYDEGTIIQEITSGYKRHGKALRHSKVVVSSGKGVSGESGVER
ncbi:MAG: nucleotide exchange factor GrpE [bacterium]